MAERRERERARAPERADGRGVRASTRSSCATTRSAQVARAELERRGVDDGNRRALSPRLRAARLGCARAATSSASSCDAREAEDVGLRARRRRSGNGHYDRFRGRLMFPIRDLGGRVVAFSGRMLPDPAPPTAQRDAGATDGRRAQVRQQPGGPALQQGRGALRPARGARRAAAQRLGAAVRGQLRPARAAPGGFGNAVAPMGTAFTATQAKLLGRFGQRATLLFDGDAAGAKAVRAAFPLLAQHGLRGLGRAAAEGRGPGLLPARARRRCAASAAWPRRRASSST